MNSKASSKSSEIVTFGEVDEKSTSVDEDVKIQKMIEACRTILECIGEDPTREGLLETPERWAKALLFVTKG